VVISSEHGGLMSLFDRVRSVPVLGTPVAALAGVPLRLGAALAGATAALVSMTLMVLPVLVAWVSSPQSSVPWPRALSVGSCIWLLANGVQLSSGPAAISLMPMLLTAVPLFVATVAARRIITRLDDQRPPKLLGSADIRRDVVEASAAFTLGYAAVGLVVALSTANNPLHASALGSVMGTAVVAAAAAMIALLREFGSKTGSVAPEFSRWLDSRVPIHLRRAIRPGLWGILAIFGAGVALTLVMVVFHLGRIGRLYDALGADPVGIALLSLGQLMVLPNVGLWAASWTAGAGFSLGQGTAITWSHSNPGLLPLVPGLGAIPAPGPLPAGLWLSALIPVAAGALVGWRALHVVARLSSWRAKAETAGWACLIAALVLTLASSLSGGSVGAARLTGLGAPSLVFGAMVLGELLVGASVVVGLSHLRASRS
jgi:Family of unknown function (DUF6350)